MINRVLISTVIVVFFLSSAPTRSIENTPDSNDDKAMNNKALQTPKVSPKPSKIELVVNKAAPLLRVEFDQRIYSKLQTAYFQDLNVVDANNNSLPFLIQNQSEWNLAEPSTPAQHERTANSSSAATSSNQINLFPIYQTEQSGHPDQPTSQPFKVEFDQQGRIQSLSSGSSNSVSSNSPHRSLSGYLFEVTGLNNRSDSVKDYQLRLIFSAQEDNKIMRFNLEQSADLLQWSSVADNQLVAILTNQGQKLVHSQLKLEHLTQKYLRLTIIKNSDAIAISEAWLDATVKPAGVLSWSQPKRPKMALSDRELVLDLQGNTPVSALEMSLNSQTPIIEGELHYRQAGSQYWRKARDFNVYQLSTDSVDLSQTQLSDLNFSARELRFTVKFPHQFSRQTLPLIAVGYYPHNLLFVPSGKPPYYLIFAQSELNQPQNNGSSSIKKMLRSGVPFLEQGLIGEAKLGQLVQGDAPLQFQHPLPWQSILLWSLLILGVLLMLMMARKLSKDLKSVE